jgi:glycosyltransferase involved in cell wall biosynthesis
MNVLLVSHGAALGGSPISLLNIAHHRKDPEIRYHYAFAADGPIVARAREVAESVHVIPHTRILLGLPIILRFLFLILSKKIDVVHLNTFTSYYKYPAIAAALAGKKVVWFVRENPEEKRCTKLKGYANRLADRVVTVSHDTAHHMGYVRKEILTTIHNGVDTEHFSPQFSAKIPEKIEEPYILNISSFEPRKGVLDLIKGFAASSARDHYKLLLLGEDRTQKKNYLNSLRECIAELGIEDRVLFVEPKQDVRPYIAQSTIIALVSYWEGLSRVLLEATAMGKPILASRNGGNKEVVLDGGNGILVDAGEIDQITEGMNRMIEEADLDAMAQRSREIAVRKFSIESNIGKIEALYRSL